MFLLAVAAAWLLLTRPTHQIEGDFLEREDRRSVDEWLEAQLDSTIAQHRARACLALGRIGDERTLDLLLKALTEEAASVRAMAAFGIGLMEDRETLAEWGRQPQQRAAEGLMAALGDDERAVVTYAVEALGKMGWKAAQVRVTQTAAPLLVTFNALARLEARELAPWIAQGLKSDNQDTRWAAAVALIALDAPIDEGVTRSFVSLTKDVNLWARAAAVKGLGRAAPSADVLAALKAMSNDRDAKVRIEALRSLGMLRAPDTLAVLVAALGDPNENVRCAGLAAMAQLGDRQAIEVLQSLRFQSSPVAYQAERSLATLARSDQDFFGSLPEPAAVPAAYRNPAGVQSFVEALGDYRSARSVEWLGALWQGSESHVKAARADILRALAKQGVSDLPEYLAKAVVDPDDGLRLAALELMEQPPLDLCAAAYRRARQESVPAVSLAALDAADRAQRAEGAGEGARALWLEALEDPDRGVRIRAVKYLRLRYGEDHAEQVGPADPRYLPEDYQRIARTIGQRLSMETSVGVLEIELDYDNAALTSESFVELARQGYFNGQRFTAVLPVEWVRAGARRDDDGGGPAYILRPEINTQPFLRGSLGIAKQVKDSAGSQFFVCLTPQLGADGRYTNFGRLLSGDDLLDRFTTETRILRMIPR